jgi:hypothetical protein
VGPAKEFKEVFRGQKKCRLLIILPKYRFRERLTHSLWFFKFIFSLRSSCDTENFVLYLLLFIL